MLPVFTGSVEDHQLYEELQQLSGVHGCNLAGKLSIRQSMALYELMDLAICTDSGPAHLAAAAGIPTLSIFGPTDPTRWRPYLALPRGRYANQSSPGDDQSRRLPVGLERQPTAGRQVLRENLAVYDESLSCRP